MEVKKVSTRTSTLFSEWDINQDSKVAQGVPDRVTPLTLLPSCLCQGMSGRGGLSFHSCEEERLITLFHEATLALPGIYSVVGKL